MTFIYNFIHIIGKHEFKAIFYVVAFSFYEEIFYAPVIQGCCRIVQVDLLLEPPRHS